MTLLSKTASIIYNSVLHKLKHTVTLQHNADHTHALKHSATSKFCYIWPNICLNPGMLHYGLARWLHFMLFSLFRLSNQEHWQQKIRLLRKTEIQIPFPTIASYQKEPKCFLLSGPFIITSSERDRVMDEICWDLWPNTFDYFNTVL